MSKYTCEPQGLCIACDSTESWLEYCQENGYKQPVECEWNKDVEKEYKDKHSLPRFVTCSNLDDFEHRAFLRNHLAFIILGCIAFAVYIWRRKRLYA
ncbi:hypothetical protein COEREDRAFT_82110 [Coemansia reversa NRRL 1564]|uniref:Uncharacterized protein n=1 Tax=Coemansia reversa (strain ATCC 12441 / NRRL 1564) TaxID=763665 RepID=A0A2G5B8Q5_COERN|nr:hypothetical protein COEREDRAFT_82110 [Coemansia reversa NRRL 1564]|eukprot:PIA15362.1 hypothetical protein COEREDRAFT_82110 [Coemansia reversa NRRL 1564]